MTGIAKLLSTLALLGACTVAIVSVGEPEQRTTPSFARVVEAELDALGHLDPHSLHWANLDAEQVGLSCVDGRDEQGVVGTPGGDAGELLLLWPERDPALDAEAVLARMHSLGAQQLDATLAHLDVHVPLVRVVVDHEASHAIDLQPARD